MTFDLMFFINSICLGAGLAMDAFSVSLANGLAESKMRKHRMTLIAGTFAFFQALMPMLGWICVHLFVRFFSSFQVFIPWIALALLLYIGIKMIVDAVHEDSEGENKSKLTFSALLMQGVATSIDALSVGLTTADYNFISALISALIIALVTFVICFAGLAIGKKFGTKLAGKASILGGVILILIGAEIFVTGIM